jgi:hypothetical protein
MADPEVEALHRALREQSEHGVGDLDGTECWIDDTFDLAPLALRRRLRHLGQDRHRVPGEAGADLLLDADGVGLGEAAPVVGGQPHGRYFGHAGTFARTRRTIPTATASDVGAGNPSAHISAMNRMDGSTYQGT